MGGHGKRKPPSIPQADSPPESAAQAAETEAAEAV
jgi:hypothetical protein